MEDFSRGKRHNSIGHEETELNQHGLYVIQIEEGFEVRDEDVVHDRQKAPHKKEANQRNQRNRIILITSHEP